MLRILRGSSIRVILLLASFYLHLLLELLPLLLQGDRTQFLVAGLAAVVTRRWLERLLLLFCFLSLMAWRQTTERNHSWRSTGLEFYPAMCNSFSTPCHAHWSICHTHRSLLLLGGHLTIVMGSMSGDGGTTVAML